MAETGVETGAGVVNIAPDSMTLRRLYPQQIFRNDESLTLREVNQDLVAFKNLVESIQTPRTDEEGRVVSDHGLLNPIVVRPLPGQEGKYALIDGLHRFTAWKIAFGDSKPIPSHIVNLSEIQVVKAQIQGNALKVETKRAQFAEAIVRYLDAFPDMSLEDVAKDLNIEAGTLRTWLTLTKLPAHIKEMVDSDPTFPVSVAYVLAKFTDPKVNKDPEAKAFWEKAQKEWIDHYFKIKGEHGGLNRWMGEAAAAVKRLKKERKEGKTTSEVVPGEMVAPVIRPKKELEIEFKRVQEEVETNPTEVPDTKEVRAAFQRGYAAALEWVLSMDDETYNKRKDEKEQQAEQRKAASEEKKAGKKAETVARSTGLFGLFGKKAKK